MNFNLPRGFQTLNKLPHQDNRPYPGDSKGLKSPADRNVQPTERDMWLCVLPHQIKSLPRFICFLFPIATIRTK